MKGLFFHTKFVSIWSGANYSSDVFRYLLKALFLFSFLLSSFKAQMHVSGGAQVVGSGEVHISESESQFKNKPSAEIYVTDGTVIISLENYADVKQIKVHPSSVKPSHREARPQRNALAVKEKLSQPKKIAPLKKSIIHYKPFDYPYSFLGTKHQFKRFHLPTENAYKVLEIVDQPFFLIRDFSLEKTRILTSEFFNAHTFSSAFFTRPPPVKV